MDLFSNDPLQNILPFNGTVNYYGKIMSQERANFFFDLLMDKIEWRNDEAVVFGKRLVTARKVAWYGDQEFSYTYSGTMKHALCWTSELLELKKIVEDTTGYTFNSCLLNLYHNGSEGMAYHSDDEKTLGSKPTITSLSFGAERKFLFKHKTTKDTVPIILEHGSLLVMKDETQAFWKHRLPPSTKIIRPRISLTFRNIIV